jgi:glycosyltransferase involved in cell wall biosynthesis
MNTAISYLVTCHNEVGSLSRLIDRLIEFKSLGDEIVVIDDFSDNQATIGCLEESKERGVIVHQHALNNNYGEHKNWGTLQCKNSWIFQIDGDELPSESIIGDSLKYIIDANPHIELYLVPRINDFEGVTLQHAGTWGWRLTDSPLTGRPRVNFPDYQGRIYRNFPDRIKWQRRLHEKIEGHTTFAALPAEEDFALLHCKTIEKQIETNIRYNKSFTVAENQGHRIV